MTKSTKNKLFITHEAKNNSNWISYNIQARVELLPIPISGEEYPEEHTCDIILVNIWQNPESQES